VKALLVAPRVVAATEERSLFGRARKGDRYEICEIAAELMLLASVNFR